MLRWINIDKRDGINQLFKRPLVYTESVGINASYHEAVIIGWTELLLRRTTLKVIVYLRLDKIVNHEWKKLGPLKASNMIELESLR